MKNDKQRKIQGELIGLIVILAFVAIMLPSESIKAESSFSDSLAEAILSDPSYLISSSYSDTDEYGNRQVSLLSSLGTMNATNGDSFVLFSTGIAGSNPTTSNEENPGSERGEWFQGGQYPRNSWNPIYDRSTLTMDIMVPDDMNYVYYDVQFFSTEYPEYVGTYYNDKFTVTVESPSKGRSSYVIDVNNGHFVLDSHYIPGTGFDIFSQDGNPDKVDMVDTTPRNPGADAGATALHTEGGHPVSPNERIQITFEIKDAYDNQFDSSAFIDNLMFAEYARPVIEAGKTVEDLNGESVQCSDELKYSITVSNIGFITQFDNAGNEIQDYLPENTSYVSGSAMATSGEVSFDSTENKICWNGKIPGDSSVVITFNVQVDGDASSNTLIANQAEVFWDKNNDGINEEYLLTNWANVTIQNNPPVAVDDTVSIDEDSSIVIDVLSNDYDPYGLDIEIYNYTEPEYGILSLNDNDTFEYVPDADFYGMDSFNYTIIHSLADEENDLEDEIDSAQVTITVESINDPPVVDHIPGQSICDGENFTQISLDNYVYDPDNTDEEIVWTVHTARTLWIHKETNKLVASDNLDWVEITDRIATISYPENESLWGKPEPVEEYEPIIEGALFVFKPQFNAEDPGGLVDFDSSIANFTLYPHFDPPSAVTESFADDALGDSASESYQGREWFMTSSDGVGCNFEVSDAFEYDTANAFKTKIRNDGSPLYWSYNLEQLNSDVTAWEIWLYCGAGSEYADINLDFKNENQESIAKIKVDYVEEGEAPLGWIPRILYWDGNEYVSLADTLDNGWYKLRIERNTTRTDYLLYEDEQLISVPTDVTLNEPFSGLDKIQWSSSDNAIVCPMFFWDDHRLELESLS